MTQHGGRYSALLASALTIVIAGCVDNGDKPPIRDTNPRPITNRSTDEIVRTIRANESLLNQALWSSNVAVVARITDRKGDEHSYNLEGTMLFQRPRNLLINLRPGIGANVMQVGSNETEYWAWIEPELSQMWWGRHENAGRPCSREVFVNPNELVAAMGIGLPTASSGLIGPMRKNGNRSDLLDYGRQLPDGRYRLAQEYRVMRVEPYLVDVVVFYDELGRQAMTASLEDYREAWDGGPLIAHAVSVIWPQDKNKLSIKVGSFKNFDESKVKPGAFARPNDSPPLPPSVFANIIQVDADCDRAAIGETNFESSDGDQPTGWYSDGTPYYGPVELRAWPGDDAAREFQEDDTSAQPPEAP